MSCQGSSTSDRRRGRKIVHVRLVAFRFTSVDEPSESADRRFGHRRRFSIEQSGGADSLPTSCPCRAATRRTRATGSFPEPTSVARILLCLRRTDNRSVCPCHPRRKTGAPRRAPPGRPNHSTQHNAAPIGVPLRRRSDRATLGERAPRKRTVPMGRTNVPSGRRPRLRLVAEFRADCGRRTRYSVSMAVADASGPSGLDARSAPTIELADKQHSAGEGDCGTAEWRTGHRLGTFGIREQS